MFNWLNRELSEHAPVAGALAVLTFILTANFAYNFVRDFGVNNNVSPSEVQRDRR